jgi:DNA-directed RNA polymerase specialized sigma24 family protein
MKYTYNDGSVEENAVQNRFTAYLKVSLEHNAARYEAKLRQKNSVEVPFPEYEKVWDKLHETDPFEQLAAGEFGDSRLRQSLSCLRDVERTILLQHILQDKPLKWIADETKQPYPTVKSHYRRALEKLRKELAKE